jgi:dTDP-4-dehydrorhamnose reductase
VVPVDNRTSIFASLSFQDDFSVFSFDKSQLDISDQDKINGYSYYCHKHNTGSTAPLTLKWMMQKKTFVNLPLYNSTATGYIAQACKSRGIHMIHFSSDYVYHNQLRRPLLEDDPTHPQGIYATTKREGK